MSIKLSNPHFVRRVSVVAYFMKCINNRHCMNFPSESIFDSTYSGLSDESRNTFLSTRQTPLVAVNLFVFFQTELILLGNATNESGGKFIFYLGHLLFSTWIYFCWKLINSNWWKCEKQINGRTQAHRLSLYEARLQTSRVK